MSSENSRSDRNEHTPLTIMSSQEKAESEKPARDPFDPNIYAITKTVTKGLLNVALLTSNANQLKNAILEGPDGNPFYEFVIAFAILSILLQTSMGILAVFVGKENINMEHRQEKAITLNRTLIVLAVLTVVVNVLLAAFDKPLHSSGNFDNNTII